MFWLKECPRCHGDLVDEQDVHGVYIICLQCGHTLTAEEERALRRQAAAKRGGKAPTRQSGAA